MNCIRQSGFVWVGIMVLVAVSCPAASAAPEQTGAMPATAVLPGGDDPRVQEAIRWLEDKVQKDPEDFVAHNKLADQYLQRLRETGDATFLTRASRAARASLATLPPERNREGLNLLAQVEFAAHDFVAAREHARLLVRLEPDKAYPYQILGDAMLELGDYEAAEAVYRQMRQLGGIQEITRVATDQRLGRMAILRGDMVAAQRSFIFRCVIALAGNS